MSTLNTNTTTQNRKVMQRIALINSIFQSMRGQNSYESCKKLVDELIDLLPDFLSYYVAAFVYNSYNKCEENELALNEMINLADDDDDDINQRRSILLVKGKLFHSCGHLLAALPCLAEATQMNVENERYFLDTYLLEDARSILLNYKQQLNEVKNDDNECYVDQTVAESSYQAIKHCLCQQRSSTFILTEIESNKVLLTMDGEEQMDILLLFLRLRPTHILINGYLKHIANEWFNNGKAVVDCNEIIKTDKYKQLIKYLLIALPKYNIICYDFALMTLYEANEKLKVLFDFIYSFIGCSVENAIKDLYDIQIPKYINKIITAYVMQIKDEKCICSVSLCNIISRYNENYFCEVLSYDISSCFISVKFNVRGDMSSSVLQKPLCSALTIIYGEDYINNDVIQADKVSAELYDINYEIIGKITYYISNNIKNKIINSKAFDILFQYGIYPDGGYNAVKIYSFNDVEKTSCKIFEKLSHILTV